MANCGTACADATTAARGGLQRRRRTLEQEVAGLNLGDSGVEENDLHLGIGVVAVEVDRDEDVGALRLEDHLVVGREGRDVAAEAELGGRRVAGQDVGQVDEVDIAKILEVGDCVPRRGGAIGDDVEIEAIDPVAADERVVEPAAGDDVGDGVAGDGVGKSVAGAVGGEGPERGEVLEAGAEGIELARGVARELDKVRGTGDGARLLDDVGRRAVSVPFRMNNLHSFDT